MPLLILYRVWLGVAERFGVPDVVHAHARMPGAGPGDVRERGAVREAPGTSRVDGQHGLLALALAVQDVQRVPRAGGAVGSSDRA